MTTHWIGDVPEKCDLCRGLMRSHGEHWVDGKVRGFGPWANMCERCFEECGVGLGTGIGQKYNLETKEKVEG